MVVCVGSWVQWWVGARRGLIAKGEGFGGASYPSGGRGSQQQQQQQQQQLEITLGYLLKAAQLSLRRSLLLETAQLLHPKALRISQFP